MADGHATTLPAEPPTDARGLRMELWVPTMAPVEVAAEGPEATQVLGPLDDTRIASPT